MAYKDALSGEQIRVVDLFKFTFADGTIKYFADFEADFDFGGNTYLAAYITRSSTNYQSDMSAGEITITIPADDAYVDVDAVINDALLDNGILEIYQVDRTNVSNWRLAFKGIVSTVSVNNIEIEVVVRDRLNMLHKQVPRRIYSESCPFKHGDSDCKVILANFTVTGTAGAGSDTDTIVDAGLTQDDDYFRGGYVEMTSGADIGKKRPVVEYTTGTLELLVPFDNSTLGETYKVQPHCEKAFEKCDTIFSNTDNFGGFQYLPRPEEIYL